VEENYPSEGVKRSTVVERSEGSLLTNFRNLNLPADRRRFPFLSITMSYNNQVWTVGSSRTSHHTLENSKERGLLFICVMKSLSLKPVRPAIYLEIAPPQLWCVPPAFCSRIIGRLLRVLPHQISHIDAQYIHTMDCYTVSREVSGASIDAQAR